MVKQAEKWVIWWFHCHDAAGMRSSLKFHRRGEPASPLTGVFATRAPMRPNLIALSRRKVPSVNRNMVDIDTIDAFADTPVLDIKP